uniref:Uncharacterized protein n=1 Tax=Rhabditophanes sp. KR3021 TaxID=114890 RepID=A0AC35TIK5_9BILA
MSNCLSFRPPIATKSFFWFASKAHAYGLTEKCKLLRRSKPEVEAYMDEVFELPSDFAKAFVNESEVLELKEQLISYI